MINITAFVFFVLFVLCQIISMRYEYTNKRKYWIWFFISFPFAIASFIFAAKDDEQQEPEYTIELLNQTEVRINNDTINFEQIEEYILKDNE